MASLKGLIPVILLLVNVQRISGFKAAVFEHAQQSYAMSYVPEDIIRNNIKYYEMAANFARSKGVEVIVFPEYGIFPPIESRKKLKRFLEFIPDPKNVSSIPCKEPIVYSDRPILYALSCLAWANEMMIVANMGDIQPCEGEINCPKDGVFHFNTNVAFDRNGKILAKYHKEHLSGEPGMDVPVGEQDPTFDTDLGRFAMFICFDIVFKRITEVAHWRNVSAVLFSTMWLNSSPLFNSFQYFESWAIGNNVTLLAANVHLPGMSVIGSGIVKGSEGAQVYTFNPDGNSKLLITNLNWNEHSSDFQSSIYVIFQNGTKEWKYDGIDVDRLCSKKVLKPAKNIYKDYRCLERDTMNFTLTKLTTRRNRIASCNNGMCCTLDYSADAIRENFYLGVYNGSYITTNSHVFPEENCFLARCDALRNRSCVTFPMRSETLFYKVYLKANFSTDFIYPSVMESRMRLTPRSQWQYEAKEKKASIYLKNSSGKNILVVGLKARPYDRDSPYAR